MPSSTRPATPGPSNVPKRSKRSMSDAEAAPRDPKKTRRNSPAEPSKPDSSRDTKRRRRRKKKAPVVSAGPTKIEPTQSRPKERSRAPLSARNEIVTFASAPPEADISATIIPATKASLQFPSSKLLGKGQEAPSQSLHDTTEIPREGESMPSAPNDKKRAVPANRLLPEPLFSSLEDNVAQLAQELKSKNDLIASHQALLNQVQQAVTCQVCLDLMYKPYALAPCGHLACHSCLVNWFTAPPPDNRPAPPAIKRRKTCPHCRAVVRDRPVEVWGIKGIAQTVGKSGLLPSQLPVPVDAPDNLNASADPWQDIFPEPGGAGYRRFPWFFPRADIDDDDVHISDIAAQGEDVGMLDMEDGGIYRCLDCMHEIWDGVCSSCGRLYPGHGPEGNDEGDDGDPVGWLEDQMGAEEVDVADDPGWMGLEDGETDGDGDTDDWHPFSPWRRQFLMFTGPSGFLGTVHVDEHGRVDDLRDPDEDEESGDDDYESSFIDDDDDGVGIADFDDGPRVYEIGDDDEADDYLPNRSHRTIELVSDDHDEEDEGFDPPERGWAGRRRATVVVSSDEDMVPSSHNNCRGIVESDGSDAYSSEE